MKRTLLLFLTLALPLLSSAQETLSQTEFLRRYNNLVERVGPAGLGVETLLNKWQAAWPEDAQQYVARFRFGFARCRSSRVEELPVDKYLGQAPLLPITDSLGKKHNYFEVYDYDDDLFADANAAITGVVGAVQDTITSEAKGDLFGNIQNVVTGKMTAEEAVASAIALN